jgi:hypothetical protein
MAEDRVHITKSDALSDEDDAIDEEVDIALEETFPASDPPSWTLGTDHPVETNTDLQDGIRLPVAGSAGIPARMSA